MSDTAVKKSTKPEKKKKQPVSRKEMTRWQYTKSEMKRTKAGYFMIAPFMIMFLVFTVVPVVLSLLLSFTSFNMFQLPKWVGFDNFVRMFLDDDLFITAFKNTMIFALTTGPASFLLSFILAWFINELSPKARALVTFIFYAPGISGGAHTIFLLVFRGDIYGFANGWLMKLGIISEPILFFQNETYIVPLMIFISIWTSLGISFLSFIAGLQGVDRAQYEAGAVDGIKNRWQEVWFVTLPNMKSMLMFGAVMSITNAFGFGAIVTLLCGTPSVNYCAWTLNHHLTEYMSTRFEFGYASAIAFFMFILMFASNRLVNKILAKVGQ